MMTLARDCTAEAIEPDDVELDRRHRARVADLRLVRLFEPFAGKFFAGVTANVSVEGMCLVLPSAIDLRVGRFVTLHGVATGMRMSGATAKTLTARVVWLAADEANDAVRVGLQLYAATQSNAA